MQDFPICKQVPTVQYVCIELKERISHRTVESIEGIIKFFGAKFPSPSYFFHVCDRLIHKITRWAEQRLIRKIIRWAEQDSLSVYFTSFNK